MFNRVIRKNVLIFTTPQMDEKIEEEANYIEQEATLIPLRRPPIEDLPSSDIFSLLSQHLGTDCSIT